MIDLLLTKAIQSKMMIINLDLLKSFLFLKLKIYIKMT